MTKDAIPALVRDLGSPWGAEVDLELVRWESGHGGFRTDFRVRLRWCDQTYEFAAESKSRSTPRTIDQAVLQAQRASQSSGLLPMIIVPYLDDRRLDRLAEDAVSGIDLSGNGIAIVPGRLLLRRSGRPNRYPESQPAKYAYRGATSIVPRVFLCQPEFGSVNAIRDAIAVRGGAVALSTISKALARMVEDVLIERDESRIALVQPEALLDRLRDSFRTPIPRDTTRVKIKGPMAELFKRANQERPRSQLVLSGPSSHDRYTAGLRSDELVAYCESLRDLRVRVGDRWEETERFAELTVVETNDRAPFFDARTDADGLTYASPLQAYLELAEGDKRDKEIASEIRTKVLLEVEKARRT